MKKILSMVICAVMLAAMIAVCIPAASGAGFWSTAELLSIKEHIENDADMNEYATVQGACTDGRYAYFAAQQGSTVILKYDMRTWKLVDSMEYTGGELGHANDMTYNPARNLIIVANNGPDYKRLTGIDPDTLAIRGTATLKINIYSIAYNPDRDIYVAGISGGYKFALLDNKFKVLKKFKGQNTGYTRQGCDCDENYIYFAQSGGDNAVVIYDYGGKYVDIVSLGHSHEVENLFHVNKSFFTTLHYYGNSVQRVGLSANTEIRYRVNYDPGEGYGEMDPTWVHYGEQTPLSANSFLKTGYFFGGWRANRSSDGKYLGFRKYSDSVEWLDREDVHDFFLYDDREAVSETVKFGSVTMTPFWIAENYVVRYDSDGAEGWMPEATVGYYDEYEIPPNGYEKPGYIFTGFTAYRDYDDRYYGYRKNGAIAEWLDEDEVVKLFEFRPGEAFGSMTFDGVVTLTPVFRFAYTYNDDNTVLTEYIGFDEIVNIPNPSGQLNTIGEGAFHDNFIFTELHIPDTVETVESHAISNCGLLKGIYFKDNFPDNFALDSVTRCESPAVYVEYGGKNYLLGYAAGEIDAQILRFNAGALRWAISDEKQNTE